MEEVRGHLIEAAASFLLEAKDPESWNESTQRTFRPSSPTLNLCGLGPVSMKSCFLIKVSARIGENV